MRRAFVADIASGVWLFGMMAFAVAGLVTIGGYLASLGPSARGTLGTSDLLLYDATATQVSSEALASALGQAPPGAGPVVVIGTVSEVQHSTELLYLVSYLGWPHSVAPLLCRGP